MMRALVAALANDEKLLQKGRFCAARFSISVGQARLAAAASRACRLGPVRREDARDADHLRAARRRRALPESTLAALHVALRGTLYFWFSAWSLEAVV
eukprot:6201921-Pleurochrysis_carterae.AAC.1